MISIIFKSTMPALAVITKFTTAALMLVALAACNSGGGGGGSSSSPKKTTPTSVFKTLNAAGKDKAIDISWDAVTGADSYTVYYSKGSLDKTSDAGVKATAKTTDTSISIADLSDDTTYNLRVEAIIKAVSHLSKIVTAKTNKATVITIPEAPTIQQAIGKDKAIDLSWGSVTGATGYKIYYSKTNFSDTSDVGVTSKTVGALATSTSIDGLENGTEYFIRLVASNSGGDSALSIAKSAITILPAPTGVVATGGDELVDISWDAVTGATSYKVYYHIKSFSDTTDSAIQSTTATAETKFRIIDLDAVTNYYFGVIASNAKVSSVLSEIKLTRTKSKTNDLDAPGNVMATPRLGAIDLTWDSVTGADSYKVYYHIASFNSQTESNVQEKTTDTTSITGLLNGTKYFIRIVATDATGDSVLSDEVSAITILPAPASLGAIGKDKAIDLTWDAVDDAAKYTVYYHTASFDDTSDSGVKSETVDAPATSIRITDLSSDTEYFFRVIVVNPDISSALSQEASATTKLPAPINVKAAAREGAIDLTWDAVTNATSYKVYYSKATISDTTGVPDKTTDATSISITGLDNGTEYFIRLVASSNTKGDSALSDEVSVITGLPAPTDVVATGKDKTIDLIWDAVNEATSYTVYYHTASFDSTTDSAIQSQTGITATNFSLTGLQPDSATYYFRVIAVNPKISSALSQIASAATKSPLPRPSVSAAASISRLAAVDLSWDAVSGVTGYNIYYATKSLATVGGYNNYRTAENGDITIDISASATSVTIGDLTADTTYYFVVTADYSGDEAAADEVSTDSSYIDELAVGGEYGCVRLNTGSIKCWGKNDLGQLGVGSTDDEKTTATSVPNLRAKQLSAGDAHSCAIDLSNKLYCWGGNGFKKLGLSSAAIPSRSPRAVQASFTSVSLVSAGTTSTCAVADGNNYCWGYQNFGGLGNSLSGPDSTADAQPIRAITSKVKQFALSNSSGCAIDAIDTLWCWGNNKNGQVGFGTPADELTVPVNLTLKGGSKATMLDGGTVHYCAVDKANKIQCWGGNFSGQLGVNSAVQSFNSPQYVLESTTPNNVHLGDVSKVATGESHSCALLIADTSADAGGKVRCWGAGANGRIGTDTTANRLVANTDMPGIDNAIAISAGKAFTCVLLADKASVRCWGLNDFRQLGNSGTTGLSSHTPVAVDGIK